MASIWQNHANDIAHLIDQNDPTKAHLYLETLMLLPVDIQDKIIHEISSLPKCSNDKIEAILTKYSAMAMSL